jgi:hypothetical protein
MARPARNLALIDENGKPVKVVDLITGEHGEQNGNKYIVITVTTPIASIHKGTSVRVVDLECDSRWVGSFVVESVTIPLQAEHLMQIQAKAFLI